MSIIAPKLYDELSPLGQAIERGYQKWAKGNCHEIGCGCVTVCIYNEVRELLEECGWVGAEPPARIAGK